MEGFYASIIFIGIFLILVVLVMVALDRKKAYDYSKQMDEKKQELIGIIEDAEQMVEELNKFSDYIVNQMDLKHGELDVIIKGIDERINNINLRANEKLELKAAEKIEIKPALVRNERVVNGSFIEQTAKPSEKLFSINSDLVIDNILFGNDSSSGGVQKHHGRTKEKVIHLNSRHKEVLQLFERGYDNTEIAKKLNMGKGEIELILGMNR